MSIIPELSRLRQEDQGFKASLSYIYQDPVSTTTKRPEFYFPCKKKLVKNTRN
jgi:hypothetical protein